MKSGSKWLNVVMAGLAVMVLGVSVVRAMEIEEYEEGTESAMMVEEGSGEEEIHYYMAYPGMLPDHPLYWIKMMRDRLVEWMTTDEQERMVLWQLYADKRVGAAKVLIEGGKADLGVATGMKAVGYQDKAVVMAERLKEKGVNVGELVNQMERGTMKHAEVWRNLQEVIGEHNRWQVEEYEKRELQFNQRLQVVLER